MTAAPDRCHRCEIETEAWECFGCGELTCEDCFTPMSPMATDPVTDCLTCTERYESEMWERSRRQWEREQRKGKRNKAAKARYWRPENIAKRRMAKAERKRLKAEAAIKNMVEAFKIVGGMMR